jgi:hypothetical protein
MYSWIIVKDAKTEEGIEIIEVTDLSSEELGELAVQKCLEYPKPKYRVDLYGCGERPADVVAASNAW